MAFSRLNFRCLALAIGIEEAVIGGGDLKNDVAMGVVEREIGSQQVGFGRVDFSAASADVEDQVLDVKNGLEDAFRLAVEEFADESGRTQGDGERNGRQGGIKSAARNAQSGSLGFGCLPCNARLGLCSWARSISSASV